MASATAAPEKAHDINGGSVLYRRALCPGSAREEADKPDEPSDAAARGNRLHDLAHRVQRHGADLLAEVDPADADDVLFALERAADLRERAGDRCLLLSEHRVDLSGIGIPLGGTIDVAFVVPGGPAFACDYKFGRSWVDHPRYNWQARAYAWGLVDAFGCTDVTFGIAQPAAEDAYRWREHTYAADEIRAHGDAIHAIVAATQAPDAPLVAGDHCGFCRARSTCAARARVAAEVTVLRDPMAAVRAMTPRDRAVFYDRLGMAIRQLGEARDAIEAEALAGALPMEGWEVGTGRRSRDWTNRDEATAALMRLASELGKDVGRIVRTEIASPAEAEKALGRGAKEQIDALVSWRDGKPRLVRASA